MVFLSFVVRAGKYPKCLDQRSYRRSPIQAIGNGFAEVFSQNRARNANVRRIMASKASIAVEAALFILHQIRLVLETIIAFLCVWGCAPASLCACIVR
jgi:hypothetical protein